MEDWIAKSRDRLNRKLEFYNASFDRQAPNIRNPWAASSKARTAGEKFKGDIREEERNFKSEMRRKKNLTQPDKTSLIQAFEETKRELLSHFNDEKRKFESESKYNAGLKKMGLTPDSQKG